MLVTVLVTKQELVRVIDALTPARITLDERRGRTLLLGRPRTELVPGVGVRLRGTAHLTWDVAGVAIPLTVQAWQLLLVPVTGGTALAFEPIVEELDLKLVPAFLDVKIASAIRDGIAEQRDRAVWDFARTLSKRLELPARVVPARSLEIVAVDGFVTVSQNELRLDIRFEQRVDEQTAGAEELGSSALRGDVRRTSPVAALKAGAGTPES
jgi:hypothetical protein